MNRLRLLRGWAVGVAIAAIMVATGCDFGRECSVQPAPIDSFCVPDGGAAPTVTLRVREQCGGCNDEVPVCSAQVDGNTITLSLARTHCEPLPGQACAAVCRMAVADCTVGPLQAGEYTVHAGGSEKPMTVAEGGAANCEVPGP